MELITTIIKLRDYKENVMEDIKTMSVLNSNEHRTKYDLIFSPSKFEKCFTEDPNQEHILYVVCARGGVGRLAFKNTVIGYGYATIDKHDELIMEAYGLPKAQINELYIGKAYRGGHRAKKLLRTMCTYMRNTYHVDKIMVTVAKTNTPGINLYKGFKFEDSNIDIGNDKVLVMIKEYNKEKKKGE